VSDKTDYEIIDEKLSWLEMDPGNDCPHSTDAEEIRPHFESLGRRLNEERERTALVRKQGAALAEEILEVYHVNGNRLHNLNGSFRECKEMLCTNWRREIDKFRTAGGPPKDPIKHYPIASEG
jgi:hypothetical protein